jgi:hypothetical protein
MRCISVIFTLGFSLIVSSCIEKNHDDFFAGKTDDVYFIDFEPDRSFPLPNTKDSIDINQDLKFEFFFETLAIAGRTGFFTIPAVKATQDFNIITSGAYNMPSVLNSGDIINNSRNWYSTDSLKALYYYKSITPEHSELIGYWKDQQDKYLGFRYQGKFGWIKISTSQGYIIKELAIEK